MDHCTRRVVRFYLDGRMYFRSSGAANQKGNSEPCALHFFGQVHHFIERRRNEPTQAYRICVLLNGRLNNDLRRHHDPEVDDFVIVASQDHTNNIFADVVNVAFNGCHQNFACGALFAVLFSFNVGQ